MNNTTFDFEKDHPLKDKFSFNKKAVGPVIKGQTVLCTISDEKFVIDELDEEDINALIVKNCPFFSKKENKNEPKSIPSK